MSTPAKSPVKIILASLIIVATVAYLAITGANDTKSYYVTIAELQGMGHKAYTRHLRVAGNVAPGQHPPHRRGRGLQADRAGQAAAGRVSRLRAAARHLQG